jgi:hypothetical protein
LTERASQSSAQLNGQLSAAQNLLENQQCAGDHHKARNYHATNSANAKLPRSSLGAPSEFIALQGEPQRDNMELFWLRPQGEEADRRFGSLAEAMTSRPGEVGGTAGRRKASRRAGRISPHKRRLAPLGLPPGVAKQATSPADRSGELVRLDFDAAAFRHTLLNRRSMAKRAVARPGFGITCVVFFPSRHECDLVAF